MPIIEQEFMELTKDLDVAAFGKKTPCQDSQRTTARALSFSPDDHWIFEVHGCAFDAAVLPRHAYRNALHQGQRHHPGICRRAFSTRTPGEKNHAAKISSTAVSLCEGSTPWPPLSMQATAEDVATFAHILDRPTTDIRTWAFPEPLWRMGSAGRRNHCPNWRGQPAATYGSHTQAGPSSTGLRLSRHDAPLPRHPGGENGRVQHRAARIQR